MNNPLHDMRYISVPKSQQPTFWHQTISCFKAATDVFVRFGQDEDNPSRTTLRSTIDSWLKDFFAMATVMVRKK